MILIFKRIKSDLKEMYDLLQKNPDQEQQTQKDLLMIQQLTSDSLKKMKRNIAFNESKNQGELFEHSRDYR